MGASPAATGQMALSHLVTNSRIAEHGITFDFSGGDAQICDVTHDSKQVIPGALFCCIRGATFDGHEFARAAVQAGASAIVVDHALAIDIPQLIVSDVRGAMGYLAAALRDFPSKRMHVVGITGTNGKTTTAHLLAEILRAHGWNTEVFGTLTGGRTTSEASDLQRNLASCESRGIQAVVMEVTSHALELQRVNGTTFEVAVFTNLTEDHLDFHGTFEKYFAAKAKLFTNQYSLQAVVNRDDVHGKLLLDTITIDAVSFGLSYISNVSVDARHHEYEIAGTKISVNLGGHFNVMNSLAAVNAAQALGVPLNEISRGLANASAVAGRFESISAGQDFDVIVDYAHTPDALTRVLNSARSMMQGNSQLIVVFGCGGDRDMDKRAKMGEIAAMLADAVVITSDNPRSESAVDIAMQINAGVRDSDSHKVLGTELDRRAAIGKAISIAKTGDVVVIAGKGHESTQTIGTEVFPFSDAQVARELLGVHS